MRSRTAALLMAVALVVAGALVAPGAASAAPPCRAYYSGPTLSGNHVSGTGLLVCDDPTHPSDGEELPVAIQALRGGVWVTVASGTGAASYACAGTTPTMYRLGQRRIPTRTLNCA